MGSEESVLLSEAVPDLGEAERVQAIWIVRL
jgi:hypothetical protein